MNMKEEDMRELTASEIQKIERVNESFKERAQADAELERQKKYRILFERAPPETLPFIVYVIFMGASAIGLIVELVYLEGTKLWIGAVLLVVIMILPLTLLPHKNWKESWRTLTEYIKEKIH
jgi:hypothetical protein